MRIAVNTRFLIKDQLEGYGYFIQEIFRRLANKYSQHDFIFFFDRPCDDRFVFSKNVTPVFIPPKARHALLFRWWYDVKIPAALKKYKADVFVSPDGFCSLFTKVPQVLVVHDLAFLHFPAFIPRHHLFFYKRYTPKFLRKAKVVVTVSEFSRQDIIQRYKVSPEKIENIGSAARPVFKPIDWQEKEHVKQGYADGCEYFVFVGGIHPRKNFLNLLKAFSLFKIRQHTNMKLVVVGRFAWKYQDTLEKLKTYKFRNEVKMLGYLPEAELARVVAGAYALAFPSFFEGFGVPVLEAMQCGVPVITSNSSSMPEVGGKAALYADPFDPSSIAERMKVIFKDEVLRDRMIKEGMQQAENYSWDKTADLMWQAIERAAYSNTK